MHFCLRLSVACLALAVSAFAADAPLRVGMIGLDTSHVPVFTKLFNNPENSGDLAGLRVVAGYPGGTDLPASRDRVANFTEQLRGMGVEIVDSIPELLKKVDVVLLESVDGRIHLEEARQVLAAGKPMYIDKPLAGSLADAVAIVELSKRHGTPFFSCSSTRFSESVRELQADSAVGEILGMTTWGPCSYQEGIPELFFYGIHGVEVLFTLMGQGCVSVTRSKGAQNDVTVGVWQGERIGSYRGLIGGKRNSGLVVFGSKGVRQMERSGGYEPLCLEIAKFFKTRVPPVRAEETLEIHAFMEAADESLRRGGVPVRLDEVLDQARRQAAAKLAE
jgi:predicted dehydrogenase